MHSPTPSDPAASRGRVGRVGERRGGRAGGRPRGVPRPVTLAALLLTGLVGVAAAAPPVAAAATPAPPAPAAVGSAIGGPLLASPGVVVRLTGTATALPALSASSWVLADLDTGEVIAAKAAHQRLRPASTLKTLTALTLLPTLDPSSTYTGTADDANAEGSRAGIVPGGTYTVHDLWNALFLPSGNDAAHALATANGGMAKTVAEMNAVARELQALDTTAKNPSGLDADGQLSSAYDLALIARAGMARSDFAAYAKTVSSRFPGRPTKAGTPGPTFALWTQNHLLTAYPGAIGIKTGYTTLAQNTYVAAAERPGHRLVVTLMHSSHGVWKEARALLDWGFRNDGLVTPVGTLVDPAPTTLPAPSAVAAQPATAGTGAAPAQARNAGAGGAPWTASAVALVALAVGGGVLTRRRALAPGQRPRPRPR